MKLASDVEVVLRETKKNVDCLRGKESARRRDIDCFGLEL